MGIFSSKKQVEEKKHVKELKTALIGGYAFSKLKDEVQRQTILTHIYKRIHKRAYGDPKEWFNKVPAIVRGGYLADAMIELDIPHGVSSFDWTFIPHPFYLDSHSPEAMAKALGDIRKLGIDPELGSFPEQLVDNKMFVEEESDGNLVDEIKHGQDTHTYTHTFTYPNGDKYVGEWKDGRRHGQGTMIFANGEKYVGEWKDDKKCGQGTYTRADGKKYVRVKRDAKKQGQDTYTYPNGDKYVGEWKDGKRHGQGTMIFANGEKYVGGWKDDKKCGQGTYTRADGRKYVRVKSVKRKRIKRK